MVRNVTKPRESKLIGMPMARQPAADSGSALQARGNEENNCTLLLAYNPSGYTDASFFFLPEVGCDVGPILSRPLPHQSLARVRAPRPGCLQN